MIVADLEKLLAEIDATLAQARCGDTCILILED